MRLLRKDEISTLDIIKKYTNNLTVNVMCYCKSCAPKGWLRISIEDMARACDENGVDYTDHRQLGKLSHKLIQQAK